MASKNTVTTIAIDSALHAEVLRACPDGYKIKSFMESLVRAGLAQLKKGTKKK